MSREIGSRPRCVILTVRRAVFICGETDVIVPWIIVPVIIRGANSCRRGGLRTIFELNRYSLVRTFHKKPTMRRTVSQAVLWGVFRESSACAIMRLVGWESLPDKLHRALGLDLPSLGACRVLVCCNFSLFEQ